MLVFAESYEKYSDAFEDYKVHYNEEDHWKPVASPYGDYFENRLKPTKKDPKNDKFYYSSLIPGKPYFPPYLPGSYLPYYGEGPVYSAPVLYTSIYPDNFFIRKDKEIEKPLLPNNKYY